MLGTRFCDVTLRMGAYQRTIWPNGLPTLLRRAGDQRQHEALRAFYMDGLSSSVKVRGGTADPSGSSNRIANSPMLGQFRSVEIQARGACSFAETAG
jgi:hypothetical protein